MTLAIIKRTEQEFAEWLSTEWGFLAGLADKFSVIALAHQKERGPAQMTRVREIGEGRLGE